MWQKTAFLAFFIELCLAQKGAIVDLHARRSDAISGSAPGLIANSDILEVASSPASSTDDTNILELRSPQDGTLPEGVFTTVLFPLVPTEAPTAVAVPTVITYTGVFDPAVVPTGYSIDNALVPAPTPVDTGAQTPPPVTDATPAPTDASLTNIVPTPTDVSSTQQLTETPDSSSMPTPSSSTSILQTSTSASSTSHSTTSTTSTLSSSHTSSSKTSSGPSSSNTNINAGSSNQNLDPENSLSKGAVAGIAIAAVAVTAMLAGLLIMFLRRRQRNKHLDSPTVYPQEAYLYDPPITPPGGLGAGAAGMTAMRNITRPGTPDMGMSERSGLLAGAAAGGAAAPRAASTGRRGSLSGNNSPNLRPTGMNGYSPIETSDITDLGGAGRNPFLDPSSDYRTTGRSQLWPANPDAPSGLVSTPPGSAGGPATAAAVGAGGYAMDPVESRSQTPGSMYRDHPNHAGASDAGPSIAGVGSPRYERRVSSNNLTTPTGGYNPAMTEARRAWGLED